MLKFNMALATVLLMGCGTVPVVSVDSGVVADARVMGDAMMEVEDADTDAAVEADAGNRDSATADAGTTHDAAPADVGVDASVDAAGSDAAAEEVDAAVEPDAAVEGPGAPVELGVSGDGSCLLTDNNEMWCWGHGNTTPVYIADAVELRGTCAVALDGHAFCWGETTLDYAGTDVAVLGVQAHVARPSGDVQGLGLGAVAPWVPTSPVASMPAQFCAISTEGGLTCWDWALSPSRFTNHWEAVRGDAASDVSDVGRRGSFTTSDIIVCYAWSGTPSIQCHHSRGLATPSAFAQGTEVEISGGRACALVPVGIPTHLPGVYCTADHPSAFGSSGSWPLVPLPAADPYMDAYTNIIGTHLAVGANHACIMQGEDILCWGDGRRGQLGTGSTASSRTPQSIVW